MSARQLHVAVTTDDGKVHKSTYTIDGPAWSRFEAIATLNGPDSQNRSVTVDCVSSLHRVATVDDSLASELRCSFQTATGWTPALRVATGIGLARANRMADGAMELLGLGAPETAGWSFGLPVFWVQASGTRADRKGDAAAYFDLGDLDPADLPSSLDFSGHLGSKGGRPEFLLCLATESGGVYFGDAPRSGTGRITDLKATGAGDPGFVIGVACTGPEVFVVNDAGKIWHASRRPDGTWRAFGDVNAATRSSESFRQIAVVSTYENGGARKRLHLLAITTTGGLFHAYRTYDASPDPIWSSFSDVKAAASNPGAVQSVDLAPNEVPD
jgi:hypothetical protein